jgi:alpha,alpha-trehalose-phosphate synthase [UDP-forming]
VPCDPDSLRTIVAAQLGRGKLIVVSNREPYVHSRQGDAIRVTAPAGGLVTALDPVMRTCGGTWIAHGSGDADRAVVDAGDRVAVPPDRPRYALRRVWLTEEEEQAYYYGFANQALWPLMHVAYTRPRFKVEHWRAYQAVNQRFADAVLTEAGDEPAWVFVQDYHFALLPRMVKERRPDLFVAHFWHIPWPNPEIFAVCPWAEEVVAGLLGNDLLGFHTPFHCNNFLGTVKRTVEAIVDHDDGVALRQGHRTTVRAYPISVDIDTISADARSCETAMNAAHLREELGLSGQMIGVGVDRVDYTKGIPERLQAIDRLLEKYPDYLGRFTFLQIGPESRVGIEEYKELNAEIDQIAGEVNARHGRDGWLPIRVLKGNYPQSDLIGLYLIADLCIVSSLHDGMNLVAKEFVSARPDGNGALLLSRFTGAARELDAAIMINPYDSERFADAIREALEMPPEERQRRMEAMRTVVGENNIYDWAVHVVTDIRRLAS